MKADLSAYEMSITHGKHLPFPLDAFAGGWRARVWRNRHGLSVPGDAVLVLNRQYFTHRGAMRAALRAARRDARTRARIERLTIDRRPINPPTEER